MRAKGIFPFVFSFLFLTSLVAQEQEAEEGIVATGRFIAGQVELRWFPTNAAIWRHANQAGYQIDRMDLSIGEWDALAVVRPFTQEQWTALGAESPYTQAVSQAVLSPLSPPDAQASFFDWEDFQNDENGIFLFFSASCSLDPNASLGAGLRFVDASIVVGKSYAYRITINNWTGQQSKATFVLIEDTETAYEAPEVFPVRYEELEGAVRLSWPAELRESFAAFHVERSADGQQYERLNRLPLLFASLADEWHFTDSVANYRPHYYRVVGITPFGDLGAPSSPFKAMGRDLTPPPAVTDLSAEGDRAAVRISWDMPEETADLAGFIVARSANVNGPFEPLMERHLPPTARTYVDISPPVFEPFYVVFALDTAQNSQVSFATLARIADAEPPKTPLGLQGSCDTNGVVTLNWLPNEETDLLGYQVLTANSRNDVFVPITSRPIRDTFWSDTVNMRALNRPVFYKITAVDYNNNPSAYSSLLEVKRPDVIPPAAPLLHAFSQELGYIALEWQLSPSDDVATYELRRQDEEAELLLHHFTPADQLRSWRDSTVNDERDYTYHLVAIDSAGLRSSSPPLIISTGQIKPRQSVGAWRAKVDKQSGRVQLTWAAAAELDSGSPRYILFRAIPGKDLRSYQSFAADTLSFIDEPAKEGLYAYALKVVWPDGSESPISETIEVIW